MCYFRCCIVFVSVSPSRRLSTKRSRNCSSNSHLSARPECRPDSDVRCSDGSLLCATWCHCAGQIMPVSNRRTNEHTDIDGDVRVAIKLSVCLCVDVNSACNENVKGWKVLGIEMKNVCRDGGMFVVCRDSQMYSAHELRFSSDVIAAR